MKWLLAERRVPQPQSRQQTPPPVERLGSHSPDETRHFSPWVVQYPRSSPLMRCAKGETDRMATEDERLTVERHGKQEVKDWYAGA
jgi:hypothetical protein